ncbi:glutathione S-transferase Z1-like [Phragmites australis]|uniref:glutathione S-transferase Z1-like n=1 Tax=Phragmites australis TaxID=29695 RepID=UPI002D7A3EEC|nr:glutathione S-transferase Z1-like [Phragmites australis]
MAEAASRPKLYSYWRSSCSHRARIALNLKGVDYEYKAVNLLKGEQSDPEFVKLNPMKFVPALVDDDAVIGDSYAIALYLEDKYPEPPLLPQDLKKKALNHQIASIVGSGIQPLHNLTVLRFIEQKVGAGESLSWTQQQIERGFTAIENLIKGCAGKYATGDEVQLADVFLAPQIFAAVNRTKIDMSNYPTLDRLHAEYMAHPAFLAAHPENQPDAPSST